MRESESHFESILKLSKSELLQGGKFKDFLAELIPTICKSQGALRSSFWLYREGADAFESIHSFDTRINRPSEGEALDNSNFPGFIQHLKEKQFLFLDRSNDQKAFEEFVVDHLLKSKLGAWASVQVWSEQRLFGVLNVEWKQPIALSEEGKFMLLTASSMISQCYDALLKLKEDFLHRNEVSSLRVEEEKKKKLAKKLSDHAFYTSHSIRHPLSTILALIDLIKINWENREAYEELLQQLKIETMNLDEAIRVMTAKIELD